MTNIRKPVILLLVGLALLDLISAKAITKGDEDDLELSQNQQQKGDLDVAASHPDEFLALATGYGHGGYGKKGPKKSSKGHKSSHGKSGYKGFKGSKKGKKGKKFFKKHFAKKGNKKKGFHEGKKYHGDFHKGNKGHKAAKYGKKGHHNKGHKTKGYKKTFHKSEYSKKTKFYDSYDNGGYHKKFGGYKGFYGGSKGKKYKGGKHTGKFSGDKFGKKGYDQNGKFFDSKGGSKGFFGKSGKFGKKSSFKKGKGGKKHGGYGHGGGYGKGHGHGGGYGSHSHEEPIVHYKEQPEERLNNIYDVDQDYPQDIQALEGHIDEYNDFDENEEGDGYDYQLEKEQKSQGEQKKQARAHDEQEGNDNETHSVRSPIKYSSGYLNSWSTNPHKLHQQPLYNEKFITPTTFVNKKNNPNYHPFSGFYHKSKFNHYEDEDVPMADRRVELNAVEELGVPEKASLFSQSFALRRVGPLEFNQVQRTKDGVPVFHDHYNGQPLPQKRGGSVGFGGVYDIHGFDEEPQDGHHPQAQEIAGGHFGGGSDFAAYDDYSSDYAGAGDEGTHVGGGQGGGFDDAYDYNYDYGGNQGGPGADYDQGGVDYHGEPTTGFRGAPHEAGAGNFQSGEHDYSDYGAPPTHGQHQSGNPGGQGGFDYGSGFPDYGNY